MRRALAFTAVILFVLAGRLVGADASGFGIGLRATPSSGSAPLAVDFQLTLLEEGGRRARALTLDFGDGTAPADVLASARETRVVHHSYADPGRYAAVLTLTAPDGDQLETRHHVEVAGPPRADPSELLSARNATGEAPLTVTFRLGGVSLPFQSEWVGLDFGDGERQRTRLFLEVEHTYRAPGDYRARLLVRGAEGETAQAETAVRATASDVPTLRLDAVPTRGTAPLAVTLHATVEGDVESFQVLFGDALLGLNAERTELVLDEPGEHDLTLVARTADGREHRTTARVRVTAAELSGLYAHRDGVVELTEAGGQFVGDYVLLAPEQAELGYEAGRTMVQGSVLHVARTASPTETPESGIPLSLVLGEDQENEGQYLIPPEGEGCPQQWGDYRFYVRRDAEGVTLSGDVLSAEAVPRHERARRQLDLPEIRPGITGRLIWIARLIERIQAAGDQGDPFDCVLMRERTRVTSELFEQITPEEARARADRLVEALEGFQRSLLEAARNDLGIDFPLDDGTGRGGSPAVGSASRSRDPVLLHSGELVETSVDLGDASPRLTLWLQRDYRSQSRRRSSLGFGWTHNHMLALVRDGELWRFRGPSGRLVPLREVEPGLYTGAAGQRLRVGESERVLRDVDGTLYRFIPLAGEPDRSVVDTVEAVSGDRLRYTHDFMGRVQRVEDAAGHALELRYDPRTGQLAEATGPDGIRVTYAHDERGDLVEVGWYAPGDDAPARRVRYAYAADTGDVDLDHNLTAIWLPSEVDAARPTIENHYGDAAAGLAFDRVVEQRSGDAVERFTYRQVTSGDGESLFETEVRAEGRATETRRFGAAMRPVLIRLRDEAGTEIAIERSYDESGRLVSETLPEGNRREIERDAFGNPATIRLLPRPGSDEAPLVFVLEYEPIFGNARAAYGPFEGDAPTSAAEREASLLTRTHFDYEEGDAILEALRPFGLEQLAADARLELGDLNGDGRVDQVAGEPVLVEARGEEGPVETRFVRDADLVRRVIRPDGTEVHFEYALELPPASARLERVVHVAGEGLERVVASYEWDSLGRLVSTTGPLETVRLGRDAWGRPSEVVDEGGEALRTRLEYDGEGRLSGVFRQTREEAAHGEPGELVTRFGYDAFGRTLREETHPTRDSVIVRELRYDAYGNWLEAAQGDRVFYRELDAFGRPVEQGWRGDPGEYTRAEYDGNGQLVAREDMRGARAEYRYDGHDRLVAVSDPLGGETVLGWSSDSSLVELNVFAPPGGDGEAPMQAATRWEYGVTGVPRAVTRQARGPDGLATIEDVRYELDRLGRPSSVSEAGRRLADFTYDAFGSPASIEPTEPRPIEVQELDVPGVPVEAELRAVEGVETLTRREGDNALVFERHVDRLGRALRHRLRLDDSGGTRTLLDVGFAYTPEGDLATVSRDGVPVAEMTYDATGRLTTQRYFGGALSRYAIDHRTGESEVSTEGGNVTVYETDLAGRVVAIRREPGGGFAAVPDDTFAYDVAGHIAEAVRGDWRCTYQHDAYDRPRASVCSDGAAPVFELRADFDANDLLTSQQLASGRTVAFEGPGEARLARLDGASVSLSYDASGHLREAGLGAAVLATRREFTAEELPVFAAELTDGAGAGFARRYRTGPEGGIGRIDLAPEGLTETYARDELGRLESGVVAWPEESVIGEAAFAISYDELGGRSTYAFAGVEHRFEADADYRLSAVDGAAAEYDRDGNLARLGAEHFPHDAGGSLAGYRDDDRGLTLDYRRDALGRVVARHGPGGTDFFAWGPYGPVGERRADGTLVDYLRDETGMLVAVLVDGEPFLAVLRPDGGLAALVDAEGRVRERYFYGPFGETAAVDETGRAVAPSIRLLFQQLLYDPDSRLYLTPSRAYRPELGQWLEPEPLGPWAADHPYSFAQSDPLAYVDLDGREPRRVDDILLDWAGNPSDPKGFVEFGAWLAHQWNRASEGLDLVEEAMEEGDLDTERYNEITHSFTSALPTKASELAYFEAQLTENLVESWVEQAAFEAFGPAALELGLHGLRYLGRGALAGLRGGLRLARRSPGALRELGRALRGRLLRSTGAERLLGRLSGATAECGATTCRNIRGRAFGEVRELVERTMRSQRVSRTEAVSRIRRGLACFPPDVEVLTPDGPQPIAILEPGDVVLTRRPGEEALHPAVVSATSRRPPAAMLELAFDQDGRPGAEASLVVSREHPFYDVDAEVWLPAEALRPGDWVLDGDGAPLEVAGAMELPPGPALFNLQVEDAGTYVVLPTPYVETTPDSGVLVHNQCDLDEPTWTTVHDVYGRYVRRRIRRSGIDPGRPVQSTFAVDADAIGDGRRLARAGEVPSRRFDDYVARSQTAYEYNTTPWGRARPEQIERKVSQLWRDAAILRRYTAGGTPDGRVVRRIIWVGTEPLPTTGPGRALRDAFEDYASQFPPGTLEYRVVPPPPYVRNMR